MTAILALLRFTAAPAVLFMPWVRFDNEPAYSSAAQSLVYVFSVGWLPIISQNLLPFGWLVPTLLVVMLLGTVRYMFRAVTGKPTAMTAAVMLLVFGGWLTAAMPFWESVSWGAAGFFALYGLDCATLFGQHEAEPDTASASDL